MCIRVVCVVGLFSFGEEIATTGHPASLSAALKHLKDTQQKTKKTLTAFGHGQQPSPEAEKWDLQHVASEGQRVSAA